MEASRIDDAAVAYLDLLERCLTRSLLDDEYASLRWHGSRKRWLLEPARRVLTAKGLDIVRVIDPAERAEGLHRPPTAETMIGLRRLQNVRECVTDVIRRRVPGDLIETGVWRGGTTIMMRGILRALGETERLVWVADSFGGLPKPDAKRWPADAGDRHWTQHQLAVSAAEVRRNFQRYDLLDDQVRFLEGWFEDTLPTAPISRLAVLRLDGDMYGSTIDALRALYPKVSPGGYVIVDDYGAVPGCKQAVTDYRRSHEIIDPIKPVDWTGVYWRRSERSTIVEHEATIP